jgi:hypothetical protein
LEKENEKNETKEEYLPCHAWKVLWEACLRNGFLRVGEVHKLTKRKKLLS